MTPETKSRHRIVLKHANGTFPEPTPAGRDEALKVAQERYIELRTRSDRGEADNTKAIEKMAHVLIVLLTGLNEVEREMTRDGGWRALST